MTAWRVFGQTEQRSRSRVDLLPLGSNFSPSRQHDGTPRDKLNLCILRVHREHTPRQRTSPRLHKEHE